MAAKSPAPDFLSMAGVVLCIAAVVIGNLLEGGRTDSLVQMTAFVIVVGGTLGATMVQTPLQIFVHGMKRIRWVFMPPTFERERMLKQITGWSRVARKDGLLGLQKAANKERDPFAKKALMLLVDGREPEEISRILEIEIDNSAASEMNAARVYEAMGGYSPTIGIIGAVIGLIHVMNNLADPSALGPGIAVAFVATIYGVGLANFFFLPMANKLKAICRDLPQFQEMMTEGIISIAEGENPTAIASKLEGYLSRE
ncbi:MAG: flagellar motor protein [Halioglobus sp.]|nr:flagellar motor protein [Halioglobus sp.]